jgi:hypothetical protein
VTANRRLRKDGNLGPSPREFKGGSRTRSNARPNSLARGFCCFGGGCIRAGASWPIPTIFLVLLLFLEPIRAKTGYVTLLIGCIVAAILPSIGWAIATHHLAF